MHNLSKECKASGNLLSDRHCTDLLRVLSIESMSWVLFDLRPFFFSGSSFPILNVLLVLLFSILNLVLSSFQYLTLNSW